MERLYPDLPVYKVRLSEHDDEHRVLHCNLLFPFFSVQQNKTKLDQKKSSMEQEDTSWKGSSACTEFYDVSDDEVNSSPWNGNAQMIQAIHLLLIIKVKASM